MSLICDSMNLAKNCIIVDGLRCFLMILTRNCSSHSWNRCSNRLVVWTIEETIYGRLMWMSVEKSNNLLYIMITTIISSIQSIEIDFYGNPWEHSLESLISLYYCEIEIVWQVERDSNVWEIKRILTERISCSRSTHKYAAKPKD